MRIEPRTFLASTFSILSVALVALVFAAPNAHAIGPDAKLQASKFNTKLVQAMDECASPVTVLFGIPACDPANTVTDGTAFHIGKLIVKHKATASQVLRFGSIQKHVFHI